jgi:hypothetical protein
MPEINEQERVMNAAHAHRLQADTLRRLTRPMLLLDRPLPPCPRCGDLPITQVKREVPTAPLVGDSYVVCRKCQKVYNR